MRRLCLPIVLVAALLVATGAVTGAAPARAAQAKAAEVIADCNLHDRLTRSYSVSELRAALSTMPADVKEYTDCYDVIQRALLAAIGGSSHLGQGSAGQSSSGSFLPTPLIVVLVVLVLGAGAFVAVSIRRRGGGGGGGGSGPSDGGSEPGG